MTNIKNLLEIEEWDRLPLPDNFSIKEIEEPLKDYPKDMELQLNLFARYNENYKNIDLINDKENI